MELISSKVLEKWNLIPVPLLDEIHGTHFQIQMLTSGDIVPFPMFEIDELSWELVLGYINCFVPII